MTDFSAYLTSIGNDYYQVFIKNNHSETDFIRIIVGHTEIASGKRVGQVTGSWIISPLRSDSEKVFINQVHKRMLRGRRLWIAFEVVKRTKPRNETIGCFIALSPSTTRRRKTVGSNTYFELRSFNPFQDLKQAVILKQVLTN